MVTTPVTITAIRFLNTREAAVQTAAAIRPGLPPDMIWGAIMETMGIPDLNPLIKPLKENSILLCS